MKKINKNGFTLIELLVVVLIIGLLAGVALPQYFKAVEKSRATEALALMGSISEAQQAHYLVHGEYTDQFDKLDLAFSDKDGIEVLDQNQFETPHFFVVLVGTTGDRAGVVVERKGGRYEYAMAKSYNTGLMACDNEEICPSLLQNYRSDLSEVINDGSDDFEVPEPTIGPGGFHIQEVETGCIPCSDGICHFAHVDADCSKPLI